jgi:hypothetical protein
MKKTGLVVAGLTVLFQFTAGSGLANPAIDVDGLITRSIDQFQNVTDYTCRLDKRVLKKKRLHEELNIFVKYMKPSHYYFRWDQGPARGREVIFVAGKNDNRIVAHPGGLLKYITLRLDPQGRLAMRKNRHPLTESGMEKIVKLLETNYYRSKEEGLEAVRFVGEDQLGGRRLLVVEGRFPADRQYYAPRIVVAFDKGLRLPVKVSVFDPSDTLVEEYIFRDLRINVGFSEADFDPANSQYAF